MKRVFIVGCARSGTTLLQSLLASNDKIISFPESHFMPFVNNSNPVLRRMNISSYAQKNRLLNFLKQSGITDKSIKYKLLYSSAIKQFISILDAITAERGGEAWIEKTPHHLFFIRYFERIQGVKFIHILRNGDEVVQSLYKASSQNPKAWGGKIIDAKTGVEIWEKALNESMYYVNKSNHYFIHYDEIIKDVENSLKNLSSFLEIDYQQIQLSMINETSSKLVTPGEKWKLSNLEKKGLTKTPLNLEKYFTNDEIAYIHNIIDRNNDSIKKILKE